MFSPQTIASTLREIPHRFKKRGKVYYFRNLVRLSRVEDNQMTFSVKGSRGAYTVDLWLEEEDDEIYCACDCPYGENNSYCKHIAAALYFPSKEPASGQTLPGSVWSCRNAPRHPNPRLGSFATSWSKPRTIPIAFWTHRQRTVPFKARVVLGGLQPVHKKGRQSRANPPVHSLS
jgi:hypothetical protein